MARVNPAAKAAAEEAKVEEVLATPVEDAAEAAADPNDDDVMAPLAVKQEEPPPAASMPRGKARYKTLAQCSGMLAEGKIVPPGTVLALEDEVAVHYLKQGAIERVF